MAGTHKTSNYYVRANNTATADSGIQVQDLTIRNQNTQLTLGTTAAGDFLSSRSFRGLEQHLGETPVTMAVEGRRGIARGYHNPGEQSEEGDRI